MFRNYETMPKEELLAHAYMAQHDSGLVRALLNLIYELEDALYYSRKGDSE